MLSSNDEDLNSETIRLDTFTPWHRLAEGEKIKLARFGFYFQQPPNIVRCHFCNLELPFEPGENSLKEHLRWSPECPLLNNQPTANIPKDPIVVEQKLASIAIYASTCYAPIQYRENSCPDSVQLSSEQICRADYNRLSQRLRSFKNWPNTNKPKAKQLCEAGFFYAGQHDQVLCFSCGGGLKDLKECCDPWEMHALWYENCNYLRNSKPKSFIVNVQQKYKN